MSNFKPTPIPAAPLVRRFTRNTAGRDLIVGDIHGHFTKLQVALGAVGFAPGAGDRLFSVGDLVDRGPESMLALNWIAKPWFHAVAGNHEDFAIRWPNGNMDPAGYAQNGGAWNIANDPCTRRDVALALAELPIAIEVETAAGLIGIVHADCPMPSWLDFTHALETGFVRDANGALRHSPRSVEHLVSRAQWSRDRVECGGYFDDVAGVRAVVVGHTPMERMTSLGNVIYIDTGAWLPAHRGGGEFCIIDAETLRAAAPLSPLQW